MTIMGRGGLSVGGPTQWILKGLEMRS